MQKSKIRLFVIFALSLILSFTSGGRSIAQNATDQSLPDYMDVIVGKNKPASKKQVSEQNILALDLAMFGLYDDAQAKFQKNFLAEHPVIMALFSNQGGKLLLFRPGKPILEAPQVPIRYQLFKSVGHSALAVFELAGSHLGTVADHSWVGAMRGFRDANQVALDSVDSVDLAADERENQHKILRPPTSSSWTRASAKAVTPSPISSNTPRK